MQRVPRFAITIVLAVLFGAVPPPVRAAEDHAHEVALRHGRFVPAEIEVEAGESVTWRHEDGEDPQSVTADDGSFDSHPQCSADIPERCMQGGQTFTHVFAEVGRFPYHSRTEDMTGVVTVVEHHPA
jgi:plastocyanin